MLAKRRSTRKSHQHVGVKLESLNLPLMKIKMRDYEAHHSDKDRLKKTAIIWRNEPLELEATMDLESLRKLLSKDYQMDLCCFLDSCTAERFFRIDRGQEQLHYVTDVASEAVYVLEEDSTTTTIQNTNETDSSTQGQASHYDDKKKKLTSASDEKLNEQQQQQQISSDKYSMGGKKLETSPTLKNRKTSTIKEQQYSTDDKYQSSSSSSSKQQISQSRHNLNSGTNYISPTDRLFGLSSDVHTFTSGLLEKTSDAILRAAKVGDLKGIKDLHERGYSLLSIDSSGQTALHIAARHGHKDIVRYLIACAPTSIINMIDNDK